LISDFCDHFVIIFCGDFHHHPDPCPGSAMPSFKPVTFERTTTLSRTRASLFGTEQRQAAMIATLRVFDGDRFFKPSGPALQPFTAPHARGVAAIRPVSRPRTM
jgi:hypothetical protein